MERVFCCCSRHNPHTCCWQCTTTFTSQRFWRTQHKEQAVEHSRWLVFFSLSRIKKTSEKLMYESQRFVRNS